MVFGVRVQKYLFLLFPVLLFMTGCGGSSGSSLSRMTPTIYYRPVIDTSKESCDSSDKQDVLNKKGQSLTRLCQKTYASCRMEGSCVIQDGEKTFSINYDDVKDGTSHWDSIENKACPYGVGVQDICLDPFYSVAADLKYHAVGEVIFIPYIMGVVLPNGSTHSGYLIVRDEGGGVEGPDRFDFFTGSMSPYDSKNPFAKLGLGDMDRHYGYQVMDKAIAEQFRQSRNYPLVPQSPKN